MTEEREERPYRVDSGAFIETPDGQFLDKEEYLARAHRPRLTPEERAAKAERSAALFRDVLQFEESIPEDLSALDEDPPPAA